MTTPQQQTPPGQAPRESETARSSERGIDRSFAPSHDASGLPGPAAAFAAGRIEQARVGRVLMVCARDSEVGSHNWEPFARWLVEEVAAANAIEGALILDLRQVDRLASRGLRSLAFAWRELAEGGIIAVCGLKPVLREIFAISQYDKLFEVYDDAAAAYRAVADRVRN
jgi:anti-anti-sigma factor